MNNTLRFFIGSYWYDPLFLTRGCVCAGGALTSTSIAVATARPAAVEGLIDGRYLRETLTTIDHAPLTAFPLPRPCRTAVSTPLPRPPPPPSYRTAPAASILPPAAALLVGRTQWRHLCPVSVFVCSHRRSYHRWINKGTTEATGASAPELVLGQ